MTEAPKPPKFIGEPIKRREDPRLLQGLGRYVDDLAPPGCLHVGIVRSTHAHARLKSVNASAALALPGVVAVFTGEDTKDVGPVPVAALTEDTKVPHHPILTRGTVRYVGEPIAAVVADGRYTARDGADRVSVDYDPLPAVVDPEKALEPGAAKVHEEFDDNLAFTWGLGEDVGAELEKADRVIRQRMVHDRVIPCPMETRGALAEYDRGRETLTLRSSTQIPHILKTQVALQMGIPEHLVRVITPEVGGGFGCKLNVYREEGIVSFASRALCKPVKWIESRSEAFLATIHGRGQVGEVEVDPETGDVEVLRYLGVDDVGNVINPLLVDGQIHGVIAEGLGRALGEEFFYDENGQPLNGSFMHYALPKATALPRFELDRTTTPSPVNPLGVKGVGEAGTIASTPAIVNAVMDALSPWGVTHMDIPIRPEKVWRITKGARP
jgi:carbon-monoxide dehydrogenase large subunit